MQYPQQNFSAAAAHMPRFDRYLTSYVQITPQHTASHAPDSTAATGATAPKPSATEAAHISAPPAPPHLSKTEQELLLALHAGQSTKAIAKARSKSVNTVRNQIYLLFQKLGVKTRMQAVAICPTSTFVPLPVRAGRQHNSNSSK